MPPRGPRGVEGTGKIEGVGVLEVGVLAGVGAGVGRQERSSKARFWSLWNADPQGQTQLHLMWTGSHRGVLALGHPS